jgi:hypothetical protein
MQITSTRKAVRMLQRGVLKFDPILGMTVISKHHAARAQRAKHRIAKRRAKR